MSQPRVAWVLVNDGPVVEVSHWQPHVQYRMKDGCLEMRRLSEHGWDVWGIAYHIADGVIAALHQGPPSEGEHR